MPCYHPIQAFRSNSGRDNDTGKWPITFHRNEGYTDKEIILPCGRCIGCRLERSRVWANRCMHEASLHTHNHFITLTYDDNNLPPDLSLDKTHLTKFFKRLRKNHGKFRYYACGEYGDSTSRPHYHAIIFGLNITDKILYNNSRGNLLYTSQIIEKTWGKGFSPIGSVSFDSCAYVARYIMKKTLGKDALERYNIINKETGEILHEFTPEYTTMSRRPGIGKPWLLKYKNDIYQNGTDGTLIQRGGQKSKAPRYYDNVMEQIEGPDFIEKIKTKRQAAANKLNPLTLHDLGIKEQYKVQQTKQLTRTLS